MDRPVASYVYRGFTMSRRAYISHKNNEHPITHWMSLLGLDKITAKKIIIYASYHHTGLYARHTRFYRLPNLDDEREFRRFYKAFHSIAATKKKFINYMAGYLQSEVKVEETDIPEPVLQRKNNYISLAAFISET
jgi:hypothetical protein